MIIYDEVPEAAAVAGGGAAFPYLQLLQAALLLQFCSAMAPQRTPVGHCGQRLRSALVSYLSFEPNEHRNRTLLRAIAACDRFLNSRDASAEGLQALKRRVRDIMLNQSAGKYGEYGGGSAGRESVLGERLLRLVNTQT